MNKKYIRLDYFQLAHPLSNASVTQWFRLLAENKFDVSILSIPRILFTTLTTFFTFPFRLLENIVYGRRIKNAVPKPPLIILGHPRSGTTFLHYVLSKDPQLAFSSTYEVMAPHQFLTMGWLWRFLYKLAMPSTRPMDNLKMGADLPLEEEFALSLMCNASMMNGFYFPKRWLFYFRKYVLFEDGDEADISTWKEHFLYFLKKLTVKHGNRSVLIKSPGNTARIKQLLELFPDAQFIHIHRNPYEVYVSFERLFEKLIPMIGLQRINSEEVSHCVLECYKGMMGKYLEYRDLIPEKQLLEFRFDHFIKEPLPILEAAYQHLGRENFAEARPFFEAEIQNHANFQQNKYEMSEELKAKIYSEWKFAFDAFGYDK